MWRRTGKVRKRKEEIKRRNYQMAKKKTKPKATEQQLQQKEKDERNSTPFWTPELMFPAIAYSRQITRKSIGKPLSRKLCLHA
jgi:hypothetical protein